MSSFNKHEEITDAFFCSLEDNVFREVRFLLPFKVVREHVGYSSDTYRIRVQHKLLVTYHTGKNMIA